MKIIDAHIHTDFSHEKTADFARSQGILFSWKALQEELDRNSIESAVAITTSHKSITPGEQELLLKQASKDSRIKPVCSIHPDYVNTKYIAAVERLFKDDSIIGIKIYPGYHPVYPSDKRYYPFYKLAAKYDKAVIIHTGDTFGSDYMVKYSHPLDIDEIAVKFRETKFIIAHLGNPWVRDATELVYKNENVYADVSAFCIGCERKPPWYIVDDIRYALDSSERPDKFLYGSDWPLVKMSDYIKIIKEAVPKQHQKKVFYENAKKLFKL